MSLDTAYRDTALKILTVVATGFIGYVTTTAANPRFDTIALIWLALLAVCFAALIAISHASEKRRHRYVTQEQHREVIVRLDKQRDMFELLLKAQQQTMRSDLIRDAERYMERGWITAEEHRAYSEAFSAYEHLGLNGYIKTYLHKVDGLPIRKIGGLDGLLFAKKGLPRAQVGRPHCLPRVGYFRWRSGQRVGYGQRGRRRTHAERTRRTHWRTYWSKRS